MIFLHGVSTYRLSASPHPVQKDLTNGGFRWPHFSQTKPLLGAATILGTSIVAMAATPANPTSNSPNAFPSICVGAIREVVDVEVVGFPV